MPGGRDHTGVFRGIRKGCMEEVALEEPFPEEKLVFRMLIDPCPLMLGRKALPDPFFSK